MGLLAELDAIADVAPASIVDPEVEENDGARAGDNSAGAKSHYLAVGSSSLRSADHLAEDPRYAGKSVSRKSLLEDDEGSDEISKVLSDDTQVSEEGSDAAEDEEQPSSAGSDDAEAPRASTSADLEQDERAMLNHLKQAASADMEKGRDVRKQLAFWDTLLEGRIRLQKVLSTLALLPQTATHQTLKHDNEEELDATLSSLERLSDSLFTLRERLLSANSTIVPPPRKRKRANDFDLDGELLNAKALNDAMRPHLRTTITKWSDKVSAASAQNKFIDRNTWAQIEQTIANDGDKLIARTRRSRTGDVEAIDDPEVFDDGDFYQQLLKDVVESRSLDLDDGTLASLRSAGQDRAKRKKVVDTKASKGRKLRYHVHEKLVHFMAPQPQPMPEGAHAWHEEQRRELFNSLLGKGSATPAAKPILANGETGSLRIFG